MITVFYDGKCGLESIAQQLLPKYRLKATIKNRLIKALNYQQIICSATTRLMAVGSCYDKGKQAINESILMLLDGVLA